MVLSLGVPLLVVAFLALAVPRIAHSLPPRTAAWLLASVAVVGTGAWVTVLAMAAVTRIAGIPEIAREARWSPHVLAADSPVDGPVAVACALGVLICTAVLAFASWRRVRGMVSAWRECRDLPYSGDLAVLDDPVPSAFALPGAPGRIVVSSGMLRALPPCERQALLAHERAHLRHRHHLFLLTFQVMAAANPLLRPLARAGAYTLERWADEEAVAAVRDRSLVARAIARAALATTAAPVRALAATGGPVPQRVRALLAPPVPGRRGPVVASLALMAVCCVSLALAAHHVDTVFDAAAFSHLEARRWFCVPPPAGRAASGRRRGRGGGRRGGAGRGA